MSSIDGIYNGINVEKFSTFKMNALTKLAPDLKKIPTKIQKNIEAKTEILIKDDEIREIYFDEKQDRLSEVSEKSTPFRTESIPFERSNYNNRNSNSSKQEI